MSKIKLLVDGVFFQLNNTGIARVWCSVLDLLAKNERFEIFFLDRGNSPEFKTITYIPFPTFWGNYCPTDSQLIQDVCDEYGIDVFTSTYYTTPITTPMVLMVYDMIPELFDFDMSHRIWMEKGTSISFAQRYLCISENTRKDLLALYPEISPSHVAMAHCGVDTQIFRQQGQFAIDAFKRKHELNRPYFLFVGSRVQHKGYKNSELFFNALPEIHNANFDVFCVGGETEIEPAILAKMPEGVHCRRVELTDEDLSLAYGGALALVYPSLYEGFGMPVIEAMASGCPVITTSRGSLIEAAGDAAYLIDGISVDKMRVALNQLQTASVRENLRQKGIAHAQQFRWSVMANTLTNCFEQLLIESRAGIYDNFFAEWKRLRQIQANVDYIR
ncbi:MAG: glycosyltransferase family 4 protein [Nitrosomonas sp.]|nr:MAG: glycosyltransferase family 4 protein [Nitrosomonas sp.]